MFTGIIEAVGSVAALRVARAGGQLRVAAPAAFLDRLRAGDSIAVSGCCLTITQLELGAAPRRAGARGWFNADLSPETLRRTRLGRLRPRERVNLERPLRAGALLGGHWVQGHVDALGVVRGVTAIGRGKNRWLHVLLPPEILPYVVWKGSLAVDGVSLTVAALNDDVASFAIVPFTLAHTNFASLRRAQAVNLEADILARYLERLLRPNPPRPAAAHADPAGWSVRDWQDNGF